MVKNIIQKIKEFKSNNQKSIQKIKKQLQYQRTIKKNIKNN